MSTVLAKPEAALRMGKQSWVLSPHNMSGGNRFILQAEHARILAAYFNIWYLDFKLCALLFTMTYKGDFLLGSPLLLHTQHSSGYIPQQAS